MRPTYFLLFAIVLAFGYEKQAVAQREPNTMEEAIHALEKQLSPAQREAFKAKSEAVALTDAHFGLGMQIRNEWFRTGGSDLPRILSEAGAKSMDDMSTLVLSAYWRRLNGRPFDLQQEAGCYRQWWAEQARLEASAKASGRTSYGSPSFNCPRCGLTPRSS